MSDEQKIEACPVCKSPGELLQIPGRYVSCTNIDCVLVGPSRCVAADAIRAWNKMALSFEIARAVSLVDALKPESRDEAAYYAGFAFTDAHETSMRHNYADAKSVLAALLEKWRQADG